MAKDSGGKQKRSARAAVGAPGRPAQRQVGALCWRRSGAGVLKVLLITSRDTGRWVIPKGWPMRKRTDAGAAEREAWEEAGVRGQIGPSFGLFTYVKKIGRGVSFDCLVQVFPLEVRQIRRKYPEIGQRRVKWFPVGKAAEKVAEPELAAMIRLFGEEMEAPVPSSSGPAPERWSGGSDDQRAAPDAGGADGWSVGGPEAGGLDAVGPEAGGPEAGATGHDGYAGAQESWRTD